MIICPRAGAKYAAANDIEDGMEEYMHLARELKEARNSKTERTRFLNESAARSDRVKHVRTVVRRPYLSESRHSIAKDSLDAVWNYHLDLFLFTDGVLK